MTVAERKGAARRGVTQRVHIVGPPRSGTTLMQALVVNCFDVDGKTVTEERLWRRMPKGERVLVTKRPGEAPLAPMLLPLDRNLHFIFMLRDPRDTIVSRHGRTREKYWSNLRAWRQSYGAARKMRDHPRFVVVRYEDLVRDPDSRAVHARAASPVSPADGILSRLS